MWTVVSIRGVVVASPLMPDGSKVNSVGPIEWRLMIDVFDAQPVTSGPPSAGCHAEGTGDR